MSAGSLAAGGAASNGGLHVAEWGDGEPLLALHGFTGSCESWRPFRDAWPGMRLLAPDLPGHGRSLDVPATIPATVEALLALLDARGLARVALLGYSMGGRIALRLALQAPERISALIVESASPGIADAAARRDRVAADRALADRLERDGIAAFVDHWQSLSLWRSQQALPAQVQASLRVQRLANDPAGLARSLREAGAGVDAPVLEALVDLACPALFIAGALDARYCDHASAMAARAPGGRAARIAQAGHAAHLEQPEAFRRVVAESLASGEQTERSDA
ncbi:MAG: 2-succinyl-5-enolpyruvyl-6-hydroxy-3-cyclohexene-1-carboxylate synthase [Chloroflexi bacterium]|nr:MAG: 2-succinyl-5-enolpyruvyl-6-hydroxy-3-cyclohexene-1-carboxylate synthase [Chloroflexota bacterium]